MTSFLSVYAILPKIYYQINEKAGKFITLSLLQFVSNTGFVIWFVVGIKASAEGWLKGLMLGNLITLPVFVYVMAKAINFKFNFEYLKSSLKYSLPMIPSLLSAWILNLSDRVFIERYFSLSEVGIYSLGYKIAGLVLIVTGAFNLAYNPVFFKLANSDDQINAKKKLSQYNTTYILVLLTIVFFISFFAKEVLQLFFNPAYFEAYKIVYLISLAYLISQVAGLFNLSIYQEKKTTVIMFIVLGSAGVNILLNFLLIPVYGIYGAAYATILSFLVFSGVKYFYAKKYYYIQIKWLIILSVFILLVSVELVFSFMSLSLISMLILKLIATTVLLLLAYYFYYDKVRLILKEK
jgi:O-antigen/teichoic acid export membrane protein